MEKFAIAKIDTEDNIYITVSDVVEIERVPNTLKEFIGGFVKSMKVLENGLPASGFIGKSGVKITGIFKYGELCFISYTGDKEDLEKEQLLHVFSNVSEEDYDAMKAYADSQIEDIES